MASVASFVVSSKGASGDNLASVRGLACILLVLFHVVGGDGSGLRLEPTHPLRHMVDSLEFIRLPLFTALSGYLFAMRPPTRDDARRFATGKARRLILPLLFATIIFGAARAAVYGEAFQPVALVTSYLHLWYLQALLLMNAGFGLWFVFGAPRSERLAVVGLAAALAAHILPWTTAFSLSGAGYLTPFFAAGILYRRHRTMLDRPAMRELALASALVVLIANQYDLVATDADRLMKTSLYAVLCGLGAAITLIQRMPAVGWLERIGAYSFGIYLWHPLFASAARTLADGTVGLLAATFVASLAAGLFLPMMLVAAAGRLPLASELVTGNRARVERPKAAPV